ncbi:MAG: metallophosphoesterase [Halobacteria archaeon]
MKIGIMADTHDNIEAINKAIAFFNEQKVSQVIHCGDIIAPSVAPLFKALKPKLKVVFGNNDGDRYTLRRRLEAQGAEVYEDFGEIVINGERICFLHGTVEAIVSALIKSNIYKAVIRAHSHQANIIQGETLLINPGEASGMLTGRKSIATYDLKRNKAEIVELR